MNEYINWLFFETIIQRIMIFILKQFNDDLEGENGRLETYR